jgi:hypothetical protein
MGLFRSRAKKNREKAAAALPEERTSETVQAAAALPEERTSVTVQAAVAHRETTAESRPDPDRPGWGRTLGQQIGQARGDRASQN